MKQQILMQREVKESAHKRETVKSPAGVNFFGDDRELLKLMRIRAERVFLLNRPDIFSAMLQRISSLLTPRLLGGSIVVNITSKLFSKSEIDYISSFFPFFQPDAVLGAEEAVDVLKRSDSAEFAFATRFLPDFKGVEIIRADLTKLLVPLASFHPTSNGIKPDPKDMEIVDYGRALRLGKYVASMHGLLMEHDSGYRKRILKKQKETGKGLGASLRRIRIMKGLRQSDFLPEVSEKEIRRIESGDVQNPHENTLNAISKVTGVSRDSFLEY